MNHYPIIEETLAAYAPLGMRVAANGARLVGHLPSLGPEAFLHVSFPGLSTADLAVLEKENGVRLPATLCEFLSQYNGLNLFSRSLAFHGLRVVSMHDESRNARLPYAMSLINVDERPVKAPRDAVFFASYAEDSSVVYASASTPEIVRCASGKVKPLTTWRSFDQFLADEVARLRVVFGPDGLPVNESVTTLPQ